MRRRGLVCTLVVLALVPAARAVEDPGPGLSIDAASGRHAISPYIYGVQRSADGALTLAVINKSFSPLTSSVALAGFTPAATAQTWTWRRRHGFDRIRLGSERTGSDSHWIGTHSRGSDGCADRSRAQLSRAEADRPQPQEGKDPCEAGAPHA